MGQLLLLGVVALLLFRGPGYALAHGGTASSGTDSSSSSHSLRYFYVAVSEASEGLPKFIILGYVDDQLISLYDSNTRRKVPGVPWMGKVEEKDPFYWEDGTEVSQNTEVTFSESLVAARNIYNQSRGIHTLQWMYGCELGKDGRQGGYWQYGYDGRSYISLDKETLTWMAADAKAQKTKRKWEDVPLIARYWKSYLEEECIKWLRRYLEYGQKSLQRREPPEVKVTRKASHDNMETLICRVDGFYPKAIDIAWTRDGEVWMQDALEGLVSPNSDGTYYTWRSITIDPKDRERYRCRVEHDGLPERVNLAWEEPSSNLWLIIGCVVVAVLLLAGIAGIALYIKRRQDGYKAASTSDQGSNSSGRGSNVAI